MKGLYLKPKRLSSGNFQVQFNVKCTSGRRFGYILTSPGITLKEVVVELKSHIDNDFIRINHPTFNRNNKIDIYLIS